MSEVKVERLAPGAQEGAWSASGSAPGAGAEVKRWSASRKKEVVLRLLRGESVDALSALDAGLRERGGAKARSLSAPPNCRI